MKYFCSLIILAALSAPAFGATALIDFGRIAAADNPPVTPTFYNLVGVLGNTALNDTTNATTVWTLNLAVGIPGVGQGVAGAGADVSVFPSALSSFDTRALKDNFFFNAGTAGSSSGLITFSGLNPTMTYNLIFYGSRGNGQSTQQTWNVTQTGGVAPAAVTHASGLNTATVVDWMGVVPTAGGIIEITTTGPASALAVNFGSITEVPEPTSCLMLGLAGSLLGLRRRR